MTIGYLKWYFIILTISLMFNAWTLSGWLERQYRWYIWKRHAKLEEK